MGSQEPAYHLLTNQHDEDEDERLSNAAILSQRKTPLTLLKRYPILCASGLFLLAFLLASILTNVIWSPSGASKACYDHTHGFNCRPEISHYWGQYSPFFSVPSEIPSEKPQGCNLTFIQVLSRHGARDPTFSKTLTYGWLIDKIKTDVETFQGKYEFLRNYKYSLGADLLTKFGQKEMFDSGVESYNRYWPLTSSYAPFFRAGGQDRVFQSAVNFSQGFHTAQSTKRPSDSPDDYPFPITKIDEDPESNNTLHHGLCDNFENGSDSELASEAQEIWLDIFAPPVTARINEDLQGANLTNLDTVHLMDLCPFETVASQDWALSPFCDLFAEHEWKQYDYFQSLGKYYGYGNGHPLGPTQGVGFANELIARMTNSPVEDHTSVNHTLDGSNDTFPLGPGVRLYADFSHDNDMTSIFSALGLYNATEPLSNSSMQDPIETKGFSASWVAPFASRAYFEKMQCSGYEEELVRVLVNDRVIPLLGCDADALGRCTLSNFIDSLGFARAGGRWSECFT